MSQHQHMHSCKEGMDHDCTVGGELLCHLPYAVYSVLSSLVILSFFSMFMLSYDNIAMVKKGASLLFHSFHFMHLVFAAAGTLITFFRFSRDYVLAFFVGIFSPAFFCMMSDAVLPYLGGKMLGVPMTFHICFVSELHNVLPFLLTGVITGFILGHNVTDKKISYSLSSHAVHIFVSSLASTFYLVAHGFTDWYTSIGVVFLFLIGCVVLPCSFSDIIVPMVIAKGKKNR